METYRKEDIGVIIPVYKQTMTPYENISFRQVNKILNQYKRILIAPENLDITAYTSMANVDVVRFHPDFFKGLKGYNQLLLSEGFYQNFISYKYTLIYQLDAFVFSDNLLDWCNKNYDYIGAPWINKYIKIPYYIAIKQSFSKAFSAFFKRNFYNSVGNGGLSLRKTEAFINAFKNKSNLPSRWKCNEDYYWSLFAKNNGKRFNIPSIREAALFAIELNPKYCLKKNNGKLPFGLHAWEKYNINFWKPYIIDAGYML
jgi:hypothetical protein